MQSMLDLILSMASVYVLAFLSIYRYFMAIYFTSDTHFGHKNILRLGEGRPFKSIEAHDNALIQRWNTKITPDDVIYHLGDISHSLQDEQNKLASLLSQLNGQKFLVPGNHDVDVNNHLLEVISDYFTVLPQIHTLKIEDRSIVLCHYPILEWPGFYRAEKCWHLHGHQHGLLNKVKSPLTLNAYRTDVGVDSWHFAPISVSQLEEHFGKIEFNIKKYFGSNGND